MFLTEFSLKRATVTLLIAVGLVIGGFYSAVSINQEFFPDTSFPIINVITVVPGGSPDDIAEDVTAPLEASFSDVEGLESLRSTSSNNVSIITAQFDFDVDVTEAENTMIRQAATVALPDDAQAPSISRINFNTVEPIYQLSVSGELPVEELESITRELLVSDIERIDGVADVILIGGTETVVNIDVDPGELASAGLSMSALIGIVRANNIVIPSGSIESGGEIKALRTTSELSTLDDYSNLTVGAGVGPSGEPHKITFGNITTVDIATESLGTIKRTNGDPSIGLTVVRGQEGNVVNIADEVREIVTEANNNTPGTVHITTLDDQSILVKESISGLSREGLLGALGAVLAVWVFLLSFRSTLVAGVSIPLSLIVALIALYIGDYTLNILTLGGLTIAVGRVVDDSIVVLENSYRHIAMGEDVDVAVRNGVRQVSGAIIGSTFTTIAVFLPLGFIGGFTAVIFEPLAITVTVALLASLLIALTLVPVLIRYVIKRDPKQIMATDGGSEESKAARAESDQLEDSQRLPDTRLQKIYTPTLKWALSHRAITLVGAFLLFVGSLSLTTILPTNFLGGPGESSIELSVSLSDGDDSIALLEEKVKEVEEIVAEVEGIKDYSSSLTFQTGGEGTLNFQRIVEGDSALAAQVIISIDDGLNLDDMREKVLDETSVIDGATIKQPGNEGDPNTQLQISFIGDDVDELTAFADEVKTELEGLDSLSDIAGSTTATQIEVAVDVDQEKALGVGLTGIQVAQAVREFTSETTVGNILLDDGSRADVNLRIDPFQSGNIEAIESLVLSSAPAVLFGSGSTFGPSPGPGAPGLPVQAPVAITVADIATVHEVEVPSQVSRLDEQRSVTINGIITADDTGAVQNEVQGLIEGLNPPAGIEVVYGGVLQQFADSFNGLLITMAIALFLVYLVMVFVMGSLLTPFAIMTTIPLAAIGGLSALAITGRALSLPALFGFLMLIGIVATNGIVLIDFVNQLRERGRTVYDAIIEGGRVRIRPVVMTAVATIMALFPMSLGFTEGGIIAAELATVVIGGLITSTVLTLVVVPTVYSVLSGLQRRILKRNE